MGYERFGDMLSEEHHTFCIYLGDEKMQYEFGFAIIEATTTIFTTLLTTTTTTIFVNKHFTIMVSKSNKQKLRGEQAAPNNHRG